MAGRLEPASLTVPFFIVPRLMPGGPEGLGLRLNWVIIELRRVSKRSGVTSFPAPCLTLLSLPPRKGVRVRVEVGAG